MKSSCKPDATEVASAAPPAPAAAWPAVAEPEPAAPLPAAPEPAALVAALDPAAALVPAAALEPAAALVVPLPAAAADPADDAAPVCVPTLPAAPPLVPADDVRDGAALPAAVGGVLLWALGPTATTADPSVAAEPGSPLLHAAAAQPISNKTHREEERRVSCFIMACWSQWLPRPIYHDDTFDSSRSSDAQPLSNTHQKAATHPQRKAAPLDNHWGTVGRNTPPARSEASALRARRAPRHRTPTFVPLGAANPKALHRIGHTDQQPNQRCVRRVLRIGAHARSALCDPRPASARGRSGVGRRLRHG